MRNDERSSPAARWWKRGRVLVMAFAALLLIETARAAKSPEEQALSSARAMFEDQQYNLAEQSLNRFLATYTNSVQRPYAVLYLARARLEQSNYDGAIQLLTTVPPSTGELAGEYVFWTASAFLGKGEFQKAADKFAVLIRNFPGDPRQLEAACDEADAYAKMEKWPKVAELLQQPGGAYQKLAVENPKSSVVTHGSLLLGEALYAQGKNAEGEKVVAALDPASLAPDWQWQRLYLLCKLQLADGNLASALQNSTNLVDAASGPRHVAASRYLRGEILEKAGRLADALQSYTNNLAGELPADDQRQALLKTVELTVAQNQIQDAVQLLENYVMARTNLTTMDLARLSLGELYLRMYNDPPPALKGSDTVVLATNYLQEALANFNRVIKNFPDSPLVPQAHLDRGWCHWAETNMPAAGADFRAAAATLPHSANQAVALFKLADAQFYQHDYGAAVTNYNLLLKQYGDMASVADSLFDQALYQIVQANLDWGDEKAAQAALGKILELYPNSLFGDRGQLLMGENKRYDYAMARQVFNNLLKRSPNTPLLAEVQFAIARTYEQEGNWTEALREYDRWLGLHATNAPLLPKVEYSRALVFGKAGMETKALALFTNFVARYPSNVLAAWAQNWVADYYFNKGDNQAAEENYQLLYQKFPEAGELPYQARLMAGRAALARPDIGEARDYFIDLVNNSNAPAGLKAQCYFALADTIQQQFQQQFLESPTNFTHSDEAISAIRNVTNGAPTNLLAVLACGRLADYYMQRGDIQWEQKHDSTYYTNATQIYKMILGFSTNVDASARGHAEVALGRMAERQDQTAQALDDYCRLLYESDPDQYDPFWVEQAGRAAASIYERQKQWDLAVKVYQRVAQAVPSLRPTLQKAISAAMVEAGKERN